MKRLLVLFVGIVLLCSITGPAEAQAQNFKLAAIMAAPIQDADYGTLAYETITHLKKKYGIEVAYAEKTKVPEAERVYREYIDEGYNILWLHGGQWSAPALKIAHEYPNAVFIGEVDDVPKDIPPNFWFIDRNYYLGFYPLGHLAVLKTETGKIGYVGGIDLPFAKGEVNAVKQAIRDSGRKVEFHYVFVGDFNDVMKARQGTESLISKGVDVILSALNMGNFGMFPAVLEADRPVYVATSHTSKKFLAPSLYLTSALFNYTPPMEFIVGQIINEGKKTGLWTIQYGPGKGQWTEFPISNVSDAIAARLRQVADEVAAGKIKVTKKVDTIE